MEAASRATRVLVSAEGTAASRTLGEDRIFRRHPDDRLVRALEAAQMQERIRGPYLQDSQIGFSSGSSSHDWLNIADTASFTAEEIHEARN